MNKPLQVVERFNSIQGEGQWVGTPMSFIRLAFCNMAKVPESGEEARCFPNGNKCYQCTTVDEKSIWCDTDLGMRSVVHVEQLFPFTHNHVCITGGEPFLPQHAEALSALWMEAHNYENYTFHFETNGTQRLPDWWHNRCDECPKTWLAVSPKKGCREDVVLKADEVRIMVTSTTFWPSDLPEFILNHPNGFLSPYNSGSGDLNGPCLKHTLGLLSLHPFSNWRLSVQLHKYLNIK